MEEKIKVLVARLWNDVKGLPWKDKAWTSNEARMEQTRKHYVDATYEDIMQEVKNGALQLVVDMLDEMMEEKPSRELADTSNYLQQLLDDKEN